MSLFSPDIDRDGWQEGGQPSPVTLNDFEGRHVFAAVTGMNGGGLVTTLVSPDRDGIKVWSTTFSIFGTRLFDDVSKRARLIDLAYDPAEGIRNRQALPADAPLTEFACSPRNLDPAVPALSEIVHLRRAQHANEPYLNAALANMRFVEDAAGGARIQKIDGDIDISAGIALLMAIARILELRRSLNMGVAP